MPTVLNILDISLRLTRTRWVLMAMALMCVLSLSVEEAAAQRVLTIESARDFDFGVWANAGSVSSTQLLCAVSWNQTGKGSARTYNTLVQNLVRNGSFHLYLNGDRNATGSSRITISMEHADALDGNTFETLQENRLSRLDRNGQPPLCPSGDNYKLKISISSTELATKLPGEYTGVFRQSIDSGRDEVDASSSFAVAITVGGKSQVKISRLDSVNFGTHSGLQNISVTEKFCVYSSAANGAYRLSISSASQDANGHYLIGPAGADPLPMSIAFADNAVGPATEPITNNSVQGTGNTLSDSCSGGDNAMLTLSLEEADLQAASTGSYTGLLVLLIEPE
jgi:hypothetical protein